MSKQVQIAQSSLDEETSILFLLEKEDLRCHPRFFKPATFEPRLLGLWDDSNILIFRREDEEAISRKIVRATTDVPQEVILTSTGLAFQWLRTRKFPSNSYVPGRYYLDDRSPTSPVVTQILEKMMTRLIRHIRGTYPRKDTGRYPLYVGSDLAKQVAAGHARVLYNENGKDIPLVDNP